MHHFLHHQFVLFLCRLIRPVVTTKTLLNREPITRSVQLTYFRATAFSQVRLFLDTPFPPKITVSGYVRIEISVNKKWRPNAVVFASVFRFPLVVSIIPISVFLQLVFPQYHTFYFELCKRRLNASSFD